MIRPLLFVQGGGAGVHDAWDNGLVDSLRAALGPGYDIRYPRMPNEDDPNYVAWAGALTAAGAALGDDAILVGHSIGGTILVNLLAERGWPGRIAAVFLLAAPYVGPGGWPSEEIGSMETLGLRLPVGLPIHLFHGDDDEIAPFAHLGLYAAAIPEAITHRLPGRDHQLGNDLTEVAEAIRGAA